MFSGVLVAASSYMAEMISRSAFAEYWNEVNKIILLVLYKQITKKHYVWLQHNATMRTGTETT